MTEYPKWLAIKDIIGLKVQCIRGYKSRKNSARVEPAFIMFDDGKTYIELEEQDYFTYHDCSPCALELQVKRGAEYWKEIMDDEQFANATEDI